jgi:ribose 5-phosphate isomerase B
MSTQPRPLRVAIGADERGPLTDALIEELTRRGVSIRALGVLGEAVGAWAGIGRAVASFVARREVDLGVVCCWTGTGVAIAANKVPGVRAALCGDAVTASGARRWNDANVLALSLRATAPAVGVEILAAFLETPVSDDPADLAEISALESP